MKRRSRAKAASDADRDAQDPVDDEVERETQPSGNANAVGNDDEMAEQANGSAGADASQETAVANAPGGARVSRERALYFATGQKASAKRRVAAQPPSSSQPTGGGQQESWPGYFSTARDLDENRLAAQAARQEELQRKEREDAKQEQLHKIVWVPRKKPRTTVLAQENLIVSLQEMALQCLAKHIELLPTLEYIDATARAQVAKAVVKLRRMKPEGNSFATQTFCISARPPCGCTLMSAFL